MTKEQFRARMSEGSLILDGATGSNLMAAGMPRGVCPELWILEHPDAIHQLQTAYVEAGSQIIYAPTFGGNRINLMNYGLEEQTVRLNTALVRLSKEAAGGRALVAGNLTTTGKALEPVGEMTYGQLYGIYQEQISALVAPDPK